MTPAEFYQLRAVECFTLADQMSDRQEREVMHELALCWLRLLERANENRQQIKMKLRVSGAKSREVSFLRTGRG